jgi:hypothetical protein
MLTFVRRTVATLFVVMLWTGGPAPHAHAAIPNIKLFLDQCPTRDPAYAQIRADFRIYRNRIPVGAIACSEPVSSMPISQYTEELDLIQALRVLFYMDWNRSGYLPWTPLRLYDWMKSKINGININESATNSYCCDQIEPGQNEFSVVNFDEPTREFHRQWYGESSLITLFAHEVRHLDGFPHDSACGIPFGCDLTYDESNLSPYGIQYWLDAHWLSGDINVGLGCLDSASVLAIGQQILGSTTSLRRRFSQTLPPLLTLPLHPGGICQVVSPSDCVFNWAEIAYARVLAPTGATTATWPPYTYRYYAQSNAYLGTSSADSHVYYFGPLSANSLLDLGPLSSWRIMAACP